MRHCGIVIALPEAKFGWADSYDAVSDSEIRELIVECDYALGSLQYELSNRRGPTKVAPTLDSCYRNLRTNAQRIQKSGLNYNDLGRLTNEAEIQSTDPSIVALQGGLKQQAKSRDGWHKDAYDELLWIVSRVVSPAHALLVRCSVGKAKVKDLGLGGRAKLAQYVRQNEHSLSCLTLQNKAVELGLYHNGGDPDSQLVTASKKRKNDEGITHDSLGLYGSQTSNFTSGPNTAYAKCHITSLSMASREQLGNSRGAGNLSRKKIGLTRAPAAVLLGDQENPNSSTKGADVLGVLGSHQTDCLSDTDYLVLLFHSLGNSRIPHVLFERANSLQFRWTECGGHAPVEALIAGLDQRLVSLLSDETRLIQTIQELDPTSNLSTPMTSAWSCQVKHSLTIKLCQSLSKQARREWILKLLSWICFVFPRDQFWEPEFMSIGRLLSPLLHLVLPQVLQGDLPSCVGNDVIEVLLAASKIGDMPSRQNTLNTAVGILEDQSPEYLRGALAHQQSILSRLRADFGHSEHVIEEFCRRSPFLDYSGSIEHGTGIGNFYRCFNPNSITKRLNAIYGHLHSSHLENLVQCDQYKTAVDEVDDWRTSYNPSLMEGRVLPGRKVTISKIYRSQGDFVEVRSSLESCLQILLPQDMRRIQVLCSLADVYCDLGLPEQARAILAPEIERNENRRSKTFRRLLVSAIDADLGLYLYENGKRVLREVDAIFNDLSNLDVIDQLLHVRVLVASARIAYYESQFPEALSRWKTVLSYVQKYASFSGEGFTYAVIHLSICLAQVENGNIVEGWEAFQRAEKILCRGIRDFWIPTLATRWFPDILARLEALKGWKLYQKAS